MAWSDSQRKKTHQCWADMKQRCFNQKSPSFNRYGGRGITVCDRWKDSFYAFLEDMGEKPDGMSLDRINNDGNYTPENCRWATQATQSNNKRCSVILEFDGKKMTVSEWAKYLNIAQETLFQRIRDKLPIDLILYPGRIKRGLSKKKNKSGYLGVSHSNGRWKAQITTGGTTFYLGTFDTAEEASLAYQSARAKAPLANLNGYRHDNRKHRATT